MAIAIAVHVILGTIFAVVQLSHGRAVEEKSILTVLPARARIADLPLPEPVEDFSPRMIPDDVDAELVPERLEALVDPFAELRDLTKDIGEPSAESDPLSGPPEGAVGETGGTSIGVGVGGHVGSDTPSVFVTRVLGRGGQGGPEGSKGDLGGVPRANEVIDEAILEGLLWLARHQDESGRWSGATCARICPEETPCQPETALEAGLYSTQADVGMTSLALLSYLGAGFSPSSKLFLVDSGAGRKIVIGKDVVLPGLKWLKEQQRPDGSFSDGGAFFLYNEALAALALSEAYGLTRAAYWKKPAQQAIDFLCRAQKPSPFDKDKKWGWRYQPADAIRDGVQFGGELSEADISVTGWMVMALKSAQLAGLQVPRASIEGALDFTRWCTGEGGLVGYLGPDTAGEAIVGDHDNYAYHVGTMSSIGMCVRIFLEQDLKDPFLLEGAEVLLNDLPAIGKDPDAPQTDYYYWYYGSLALNQIDGPDAPRRSNKYWGPWNKAMNDTILAMQDHTKGACSRGGWMAPDRWAYGFGPVYTTAINVLTLEVYYRYENAFGTKQHPGQVPDAIQGDVPAAAPPR